MKKLLVVLGMVGALFGFAGNVHGFDADPVFDPTVSITSSCNPETGQVEWTATVDNSGSFDRPATVVITVGDEEQPAQTVMDMESETFTGTTTTGVTVTIEVSNTNETNGTVTETTSYSESCEAFNPVVTIDVVCSLTTGDVTWTASANNSTSTVAGSVVITVGDTAQDAVEVAAGSSESFSGSTSSDVTVTITMSNTDFPDDTATGSDVHTGDCIPVFEPTVTVDVTCTESSGTVNWTATVSNSASTVDGTIVVSGADDVAIQNSTVSASGSRNLSGTTEAGVTITVTASAEGFDDVSASDIYEGTCDPPATTTTTTTTTTTVAPPSTFPATGVNEAQTQGSMNLAVLSVGFGALIGGVAMIARRRSTGGQK